MFKLDVVNLACSKKDWLKDFSRIFNANLVSGPKIPKGEVRLFFHSGGVDLLSTVKKSKGAFFLNIPFEHIASITNDRLLVLKTISYPEPASLSACGPSRSSLTAGRSARWPWCEVENIRTFSLMRYNYFIKTRILWTFPLAL